MTSKADIKTLVRARYGAIAVSDAGCCGASCGCSSDAELDMVGDAYRDVAGYLAEADLGLGCGVPTEHAGLRAGDVVLDLGSGAGIDAFIARQTVGDAGLVIGVDMTPAMIERARINAATLGYSNVEFREGEIEALPVDDASVDVVISNCVLNLVPDKAKAFVEIHRVLKPGAHFCVSDIVATAPLPDGIRKAAALYVGCVAGAMAKDAYLALIGDTGFSDVQIVKSKAIPLPDDVLEAHLSATEREAFRQGGVELLSVTVVATKPKASCDSSCCN